MLKWMTQLFTPKDYADGYTDGFAAGWAAGYTQGWKDCTVARDNLNKSTAPPSPPPPPGGTNP